MPKWRMRSPTENVDEEQQLIREKWENPAIAGFSFSRP
jgi:hypothetical protein